METLGEQHFLCRRFLIECGRCTASGQVQRGRGKYLSKTLHAISHAQGLVFKRLIWITYSRVEVKLFETRQTHSPIWFMLFIEFYGHFLCNTKSSSSPDFTDLMLLYHSFLTDFKCFSSSTESSISTLSNRQLIRVSDT